MRALPLRVAILAASLSLLCSPLAGCSGWQSSLDPHGVDAARVADLFWFFTAVCGAVWGLVMVALVWGMARRPSVRSEPIAPLALEPRKERRTTLIVGGLTAATAGVLVVFTIMSFLGSQGLGAARGGDPVEIEVTGRQWWWEIKYVDPAPSNVFSTANEMHVPVGMPVRVKLLAGDVIHSFWVPNLAGKKDLIPGQHNELTFIASRPGIYRGQCAEFCGLQHAHMGLRVIAEPAEEFANWRARQLAPAQSPGDPIAKRGEQVFLQNGCILCHTVRGTIAGGRFGPDLTHVGSRQALAADTLPNEPASLASWIGDPQAIKPGNFMPRVPLADDSLRALADYLMGLK